MRVLVDGRVKRSEAEWRQVIARFEASGLSVARFCQGERIAKSSFVRWRQELARTGRPAAAFVELPAPDAAGDPSSAAVALELSLPGGVVLRWMR